MENNEIETVQAEAAPQPETVEAPAKKPATDKRSFAEIAIGVLALVLIVAAIVVMVMGGASETPVEDDTIVATTPADGNPDDVTCKGTYTVTDAKAIEKTLLNSYISKETVNPVKENLFRATRAIKGVTNVKK